MCVSVSVHVFVYAYMYMNFYMPVYAYIHLYTYVFDYQSGCQSLCLSTSILCLSHVLDDKLDADAARHVLSAVASGLAHMHDLGLVHRDIKTDNVFIGAHGRVKVNNSSTERWYIDVARKMGRQNSKRM